MDGGPRMVLSYVSIWDFFVGVDPVRMGESSFHRSKLICRWSCTSWNWRWNGPGEDGLNQASISQNSFGVYAAVAVGEASLPSLAVADTVSSLVMYKLEKYRWGPVQPCLVLSENIHSQMQNGNTPSFLKNLLILKKIIKKD